MTTLSIYQARAKLTAQPAAYDQAYLIPMIVGEVGELFGQRAKAVWHGWDAAKIQAELVSEYGDVCWGTAILLDMEGCNGLAGIKVREYSTTVWGNKPDPWMLLQGKAGHLYRFYVQQETQQFIRGEAQQLWLTLESVCEEVTGLPFNQVLDYNIDKLVGRVSRGTLVGQGDHR